MKTPKIFLAIVIIVSVSMLAILSKKPTKVENPKLAKIKKGCVFNTVFGIEKLDSGFYHPAPEAMSKAMADGLAWMQKAQQKNGGWGAGSHSRQGIMDPHAVDADPATTSMVAMALLRMGNDLDNGPYSKELGKALEFLLDAVEKTPKSDLKITKLAGTQIQTKLGQNIDAILTAQFLSNISTTISDEQLKQRVMTNLNTCVSKIQQAQSKDGSINGSGWAGVLQSGLANNALESAEHSGAKVDKDALDRSREYQKGNFNTKTGDVKTEKGAGIVLYSVSGSVRASAKEAREVEKKLKEAKKFKKVPNAPLTVDDLEDIGYSKDEARKAATSYNVYQSAKKKAQEDGVTSGFGNNGGEEFISFLQTGESMIINKDMEWHTWYDKTADKLVKIQNQDGSWNGHHCITSPVFCTATCLLVLSVNNDVEQLVAMGETTTGKP